MASPTKRPSREAIVAAALQAVGRDGAEAVSLERVASEAGCAKGLIHYHFKSKQGLLQAVARELLRSREAAWGEAFATAPPDAAIRTTWSLLTHESKSGVARAWLSLLASPAALPEQTVKDCASGFNRALAEGASRMLEGLGGGVAAPPHEIGSLLAAVVTGMSLQLVAGADPCQVEGGYAALWLGLLS